MAPRVGFEPAMERNTQKERAYIMKLEMKVKNFFIFLFSDFREKVSWQEEEKIYHYCMNQLSQTKKSYWLTDALSDGVAGVARVWQWVQNSIARIVWAKDAGSLAKNVTGAGLITLLATPFIAGVGATAGVVAGTVGSVATVIGIWGIVENTITNNLAKWSRK